MLTNVVPIIKKNGTLWVCIDFKYLNVVTSKEEYLMPISDVMVDSSVGFEYLSLFDVYLDYNPIFIIEEDMSKTTFRCPGALGTYEW